MSVEKLGIGDGGLNAGQMAIAKIVAKVAGSKASSGGCVSFYSPSAWSDRGEKYGTESELVIVHDGGDLAKYFNYDYMDYKSIEKMSKALEAAGYYQENCTSWYSAIYKN